MPKGWVRYDILYSLGSYRTRASRYSLKTLTYQYSAKHWPKSVRKVQSRWRYRAAALKRAGWNRLVKEGKLFQTVNCPPVAVATNRRKVWRCKLIQACPFCWCRDYTENIFTRFHNHYFTKKIKPDEFIITCTKTRYLAGSVDSISDYFENQEGRHVLREIADGSESSVVLYSTEPSTKPEHFTITQRILAVVEKGSMLYRDLGKSKWRRVHTWKLDPEQLALAIGYVASYPHGLIHRPVLEAKKVLEVLAPPGRRMRRMLEFYGDIRLKKEVANAAGV